MKKKKKTPPHLDSQILSYGIVKNAQISNDSNKWIWRSIYRHLLQLLVVQNLRFFFHFFHKYTPSKMAAVSIWKGLALWRLLLLRCPWRVEFLCHFWQQDDRKVKKSELPRKRFVENGRVQCSREVLSCRVPWKVYLHIFAMGAESRR